MNLSAKYACAAAIAVLTLAPLAALQAKAEDVTTKDNVGVTMDPHNDANGGLLAGSAEMKGGNPARAAAGSAGTGAGSNASAKGGFALNPPPTGSVPTGSVNSTGSLGANTSVGGGNPAGTQIR